AEMAYFDEAIAPHLGPTVTYVGEADATTKRRLLAGAMALVNPIQWEEPFGLVMVEALASGTPVVATRHGAAPEIVEDGVTGFLCDAVDSLAGAIGRVASIDRRTCRCHAEVRFSVGRMVDDHVRLYRRIVAGAASSRSPVLVGAQAAGTLDPATR